MLIAHVLRFFFLSPHGVLYVFNIRKLTENVKKDINNDEEALGLLTRLPALLRWAGMKNFGSHISLNYFASGSQYIDKVEHFYGDRYQKQGKTPSRETSATDCFNDNTPLSALFRENHHEELRTVIDSWQPYLTGDETNIDVLAITRFEFDKDHIYSNKVYRDLCELDALGALQVPLSQLARYLADHSNLSRSYATLYQQLKYYRCECD